MTAGLQLVGDDAPQTITTEMIAAALERFKEGQSTPLTHYDEEIGGVFTFRKITGDEVRQCRQKSTVGEGTPQARVDQDKMEFHIVNTATIAPKVNTLLWAQLGQLSALVQPGLVEAVYRANGLMPNPVETAKNSSSETPNS